MSIALSLKTLSKVPCGLWFRRLPRGVFRYATTLDSRERPAFSKRDGGVR